MNDNMNCPECGHGEGEHEFLCERGAKEIRARVYGLVRAKRDWVPAWLWRVFCVGNLATFTPWKEILTRRSA